MSKYCSNCGQLLEENAKVCKNCGCPVDGVVQPTYTQPSPSPQNQVNYATSQTPTKTNGFAIAGFVLAMVSIFFCCFSIFTAIPGLILSIIGLRDINKNGEEGKGLAIAGIVICSIMLVLSLIYCSIWFIGMLGL